MLKKALTALKLTLQIVLVALLGFAISLGIHVSVSESVRMPTASEMGTLDNVSGDLDSKESHAVDLSRQSILQILTTSEKRTGFSKMSGTYMTYRDRFYVITAAHGVHGECEYFFVATTENDIYECIRYVVVDQIIDYAIIEIEQVPIRDPVKLASVIPSNREWRQETAALNEVFYTGYPNGLGPADLQRVCCWYVG